MQFQIMGTTGVTVSRYCLGAMMFGAMGNTDHAECIRIIHRALDAARSTTRTLIPGRATPSLLRTTTSSRV